MSATAVSRLKSTVESFAGKCPTELKTIFGGWIDLPHKVRRGKKKLRRRIYDYQTTFWLFLWQMFSCQVSCFDAAAEKVVNRAIEEKKLSYPDNSAYCQARMHLDFATIHGNCLEVARCLQNEVDDPDRLWLGHQVRIPDGTSSQLLDTPSNQRVYPQPSGQKKGCGFPVMHMVAMFSLETGAVIDYAVANLKTSERELFRRLWPSLSPGQVALTDAGFCSYGEIWSLKELQVESVMALSGTRTVNVRTVKELGEGDCLVEWNHGGYRPEWMDDETWAKCPETMLLRQITAPILDPKCRKKKIEVVTTFLDSERYPKQAFADLFARRWKAELFFRDIKTTMGLEEIRCKTPAMARKALAMSLLAYNLIRVTMYEASCEYPIDATSLSFKNSQRFIRAFAPYLARITDPEEFEEAIEFLLYYIAHSGVKKRPGRHEPRAVKKRPKNYQRLTAPRHVFTEIPHRSKYHAQDGP
jgi:hypothetical protein